MAPLALGVFACGDATVVDTAADGGMLALLDAGSDAGPAPDAGADAPDAGDNQNCTYPADAPAQMTLDRAVFPYVWSEAIDGVGNVTELDLTQVFCNNAGDVEWGDVDALLFVSLDAW